MRTFAKKQKPAQESDTATIRRHARQRSSQNRSVDLLLHVQRTMGNEALQRMLLSSSVVQIQPKLEISAPGDVYEQEADRVADQVMRMQPAYECGRSCPKGGNERSRRELLQTKLTQASDAGEITSPTLVRDIASSSGQPLDPATRQFMESSFGHDFGQVRVHTDSRANDAARSIQARAFTVRHDIVFGTGQYAPNEAQGRRLLAHELTHVIQQRLGAGNAGAQISAAPTVAQRAPGFSIQRQPANQAATAADDPSFVEWWKHVAGFEGPLSAWLKIPQNKYDRGDKTNWGVTIELYRKYAKGLGLSPTDEAFAAMTPQQAVLFGRMIWKASRASKIKNTGVAIVLADWYWGGISLKRFRALLAARGRPASFIEGKPDDATIAFINTLSPSELVESMSAAKVAQYEQQAKEPGQSSFLEGWLKRTESRRKQARPFVTEDLLQRGRNAAARAREVLTLKNSSSEDKEAVKKEVWAVLGLIEERQIDGFPNEKEEADMKSVKAELLKVLPRLMDAGT